VVSSPPNIAGCPLRKVDASAKLAVMLKRTLALSLIVLSSIAHAAPPGPTLPEEDAQGGATRAQAIVAYTKDCHAILEAIASTYGEESKVDECKALDVDQNCNPDTFGCNAAFTTCQERCQPVCGRCQDTCASSCDDCKGSCAAGDKACVQKCAEGRADCRGRCMGGLNLCQERDCNQVDSVCFSNAKKRLRTCDAGKCEDYIACYDAQEDYEKAQKNCASKVRGVDAWCLGVCESEHGFPSWYLEMEETAPSASDDGRSLAKLCTAEAQCPPDYAEIVPYLGSFCAGTTSDASYNVLSAEVARKTISKRTLSIVFNAYGAIHGYEFKKEKWLNGLFYGAGAAWLPASCRVKMKTVASAKVMPFVLTKLRDRAKKIWNEAR